MAQVPRKVFFTKGVGRHREKLSSFELALRDAGIEKYNLVNVSSILPPHCVIIPRKRGETELVPGQIVYCVMARNSSNEAARQLSAAIGVAVPEDKSRYGYLSEHHSFGESAEVSGDYAEDLAAQMLASTLGIEFDPDASYNERKEIWKIDGRIYKTRNVVQSAIGDRRGKWTTVIAVAVFVV